jgi:hypothetical protein
MLYFNVKILTSLRSEELGATVIWANESPVNFLGCPSEMLLALVVAAFVWAQELVILVRIFFLFFPDLLSHL